MSLASKELAAILGDGPWLMGIVNITPDSLDTSLTAGEGLDPDLALGRVRQLFAEGAHIVDIGGESTGPGSSAVSEEEELARIEIVVREAAQLGFVSVDTYKASTADRCLSLGARMINDVSGFRADASLPEVVRKHDAFVVIMHSKENETEPHAKREGKEYQDVAKEVGVFLKERVEFALEQGIRPERIIIDPGMGWFISADFECSWQLLRELERVSEFCPGYPLLIGTSRKAFVGGPGPESDYLSQLTALSAVTKGAEMVRTHNVAMAKSFIDTWEKIA